jgi:hypothetical protein
LSPISDDFRRIIDPQKGDVIFGLATFLESFDIRTAYPLLLFMLDANMSQGEWNQVSALLESYLLRRAVLGWSTKAYNRIFLNIVKTLRKSAPTAANLRTALSDLTGESSGWPTDAEFLAGWGSRDAYHDLTNAKLVHILRRISNDFLTNKNERITIDCPLSVEHVLPQNWIEHWPLQTGEKGLSDEELLLGASADEARAIATLSRNATLQTIGNLTILTQELNSSVSNSAWLSKKPELLRFSLLPINQQLHKFEFWNEETIVQRGRELFERAIEIWPAPSVS